MSSIPVCVVRPFGIDVDRNGETFPRYQRQQACFNLRTKAVNFLRVELESNVKSVDRYLRMFVNNRSSWLLFGHLCDEAAKLLEFFLWISDVWTACQKTLYQEDLTVPIPDPEKMRDERKDHYQLIVSNFRNQLFDLWTEIEVRIFTLLNRSNPVIIYGNHKKRVIQYIKYKIIKNVIFSPSNNAIVV